MKKPFKTKLKLGNSVKVIKGFDKDKIGEIIGFSPNTGKILVKGINVKFKHVKPNKQGAIGEIKKFEAPIHHSNVKIIKN